MTFLVSGLPPFPPVWKELLLMSTTEAKAEAIAKASAIPPAVIQAIIAAVMALLGSCPKPPTPAQAQEICAGNGVGSRSLVRRATRKVLSDPREFMLHGSRIVDAVCANAAGSTAVEFTALYTENGLPV